jgi:hypothetical protein
VTPNRSAILLIRSAGQTSLLCEDGGNPMTLRKRGKYWYGDNSADLREEIVRYSKDNAYVAEHFADAVCECGGRVFRLRLDEAAGVATRTCISCSAEHPIGDSDDFLAEAELEECACTCGAEEFEISVGVSLYEGSEDVKWLYLGCRCPACGLVGVYGDWKNEFEGYQGLLARV